MIDPTIGPCGVIAIWISARGDVIATAADFEQQAFGGFDLWHTQRHRAKQRVIQLAIDAYCSPDFAEAIDGYLAEQISLALRKKGHKITCQAIGYPDDVAEEVSRC